MKADGKRFINDLRRLGVKPGAPLLVHSSYKALGGAAGTPEDAVETLLAAVGRRGTLLMPALSYQTVTALSPYFNLLETPSCVGVIPETFRKRPGVMRSMHPTHSVCAYGPLAAKLTNGHALDTTPVGPRSPFRKLCDMGGKILFLGCGLTPNTSVHGVEELIMPPYLFREPDVVYTCTDAGGVSREMAVKRHNFVDRNGRRIKQRYDRVADVLHGGALLYGNVLAAECFLLDAARVFDAAYAAMRVSPTYFVDYE